MTGTPSRPAPWLIAAAALALMQLAVGCAGPERPIPPEPATYELLSPQAAFQLLQSAPDLEVIDTSETFFLHRIPRALSYRVEEGHFELALTRLDKQAAYLVYGLLGGDSEASAQRMIDAGFEDVSALEGGIVAWLEAHLPFETSFG
ncbi:MAG: rhodanese-like domain-containing protein [Candidatus Eisenbacteria bacterium]|uniref:Rhodanese-like domain-containing protein n=1 Tax=Eiseniibacteriota bacterium TaxID=2212470 RepID=A0A937X9R8_UNCEI|nr:rhodanese-like domain-containing protein [Candidatus Eisenbacteria bacterium]